MFSANIWSKLITLAFAYSGLFLSTDQMGEMNALYYYSTQEEDDMDQLSIQKYHPNSPWFLKFCSAVKALFLLWKKFVEINDHYGCKSL